MPTLQKVHVFAVSGPPAATPKEQRRYRLKWRVDGRDKTRSFKTKGEAERLRARLQVAAAEGERFDAASGLPVS